MGFSITLMPSLPHHAILLNNDCSHQRIWLDVAAALLSQIEGAFHPNFISTVHEFTLHKETTKHTKDTKKKKMNLRLMIFSCFRVFLLFRGSLLLLPRARETF